MGSRQWAGRHQLRQVNPLELILVGSIENEVSQIFVFFSAASTPGIPSRGSATSLNRKPRGLSKIFGKKKKKLETLEDESSFADESLLSAGDGQIASPSDTPTKVKRRTSIKKLIKGKKKSEDT